MGRPRIHTDDDILKLIKKLSRNGVGPGTKTKESRYVRSLSNARFGSFAEGCKKAGVMSPTDAWIDERRRGKKLNKRMKGFIFVFSHLIERDVNSEDALKYAIFATREGLVDVYINDLDNFLVERGG